MRERPWRIGIAGAGWVVEYHAAAWRAQAGRAEVVALADPDATRLAQRCADLGVPAGYASVDAMLAAEALDILDIATPRESHAPLVRLGAAHGLAVLCQKPLATTLGEAVSLVEATGSSARLMVHDNWRFRATYRRIHEWLQNGIAGDLRHVELDYLSSGMIPDTDGRRPALVRQPNFPGIARLLTMEVLIHHLDTLRFLLGDLELVSATMARSNDAIIGEDSASLLLRRASDACPVVLVGNLAAHGEPPQARDQLRIFGSRATITLDGYDLRCVGETNLAESFDPDTTYRQSYHAAIAHFLDGLEAGHGFETAPADNLKTLALVEQAYSLSAAQFTPGVPLSYPADEASRGQR